MTSRSDTTTSSLPYKNRRAIENKLTALVSLGIPRVLTEQIAKISSGHQFTGRSSDNSLVQARYECSTALSLAYRTAVHAGSTEQFCTPLLRHMEQRIEAMNTSAQELEIIQDILVQFCEAVQNAQLCDHSGAVRQCCEYIAENLHSPLSLDELGKVCHLSPHYVSDLFRKELGIGALQYVHQIKMQYAKFLLEHSDHGIAEISALLSYPSHSNFSQRFKKVYGITPHEFRSTCGK